MSESTFADLVLRVVQLIVASTDDLDIRVEHLLLITGYLFRSIVGDGSAEMRAQIQSEISAVWDR